MTEIVINEIYEGDCLELMKRIPTGSVDMILCDLPYGTTACKWDTIIPFEPLWAEYERIIKDNGTIVLTASQPFTSALIMSNPKIFKYSWIWDKKQGTGFLNANRQPLRRCEDIAVFYKKQPTYNPIKVAGIPYNKGISSNQLETTRKRNPVKNINTTGERFPTTLLEFSNSSNRRNQLHPTQKPVALFEYLIKTYTNEGDVILDNCIGSGTTAIAAINTNRNYIGIEQDAGYVAIARQRIADINGGERP